MIIQASEVHSIVCEFIRNTLIDFEKVINSTDNVADLGLDSFDLLEVEMEIEDLSGKFFHGAGICEAKTVQEIEDIIVRHCCTQ
jgi:acyl carrier protein